MKTNARHTSGPSTARIKWNRGYWNCLRPSGSIIMKINEQQSDSGFPEEMSIFITISQSVPIFKITNNFLIPSNVIALTIFKAFSTQNSMSVLDYE